MRRGLVVLEGSHHYHIPGSLMLSTHLPNVTFALVGGHLGVQHHAL
jgi:hypothetical protein